MAVQPARGFLAGIAGGATLGFAVAGPAGAIGGAIGGGEPSGLGEPEERSRDAV